LHDARRLCYDRHLRLQYIRYQRDSGGLSCYEVFNNRLYSWTGFEIRRYFYAASVSDRNDLSRKRSVFLPYYRDHLFCPRMPDHIKKSKASADI